MSQIKVADYIAQRLTEHGITDVFMVTGGGAMHLNDALGNHENLNYHCFHHEQACAIAAEGYARVSNIIAAVLVTSGPGGTNALTGVLGGWLDSIPMLVISGQVKQETTIASHPHLKLRQLGDQEINIIDIVKPITKYAQTLTNKNNTQLEVDKAIFYALNGRPGPVWLDIPLDIQGAMIDTNELQAFTPPSPAIYDTKINEVIECLKSSKRPLIIVGNGIRLADAVDELREFIENHHIPIVTSITGIDLIETDHPLFFGRPGILGERAANFIIQNCDLLIVIGTRLNLRVISYNYQYFTREAKKIMIDIDENELNKKTFLPDIKIHSDAKSFLKDINKMNFEMPLKEEWLKYSNRIKLTYPTFNINYQQTDHFVNSYYFPFILSSFIKPNSIIVTGNGTAYTSTYQVLKINKGVRVFANVGCASMGYDLPASIGASIADKFKNEVICITGDGSIQMNIQELQTIIYNNLPIKIFMYNNNGYLSIRTTQKLYFDSKFVGESPESGISFPDMMKIAEAYGFKTFKILNNSEIELKISEILSISGPVFCEVMLDPNEVLGPKVSSQVNADGTMISKPMEDLAPFLPREEFYKNMIISPIND